MSFFGLALITTGLFLFALNSWLRRRFPNFQTGPYDRGMAVILIGVGLLLFFAGLPASN